MCPYAANVAHDIARDPLHNNNDNNNKCFYYCIIVYVHTTSIFINEKRKD